MLFGSRPGPWPIGLVPGPMGPGPGVEVFVDHFHDISISFAVWWLLQHRPLRNGARDMQQPEKISATSGWLSVEGQGVFASRDLGSIIPSHCSVIAEAKHWPRWR